MQGCIVCSFSALPLSGLSVQAFTVTVAQSNPAKGVAGSRLCHHQHHAGFVIIQNGGAMGSVVGMRFCQDFHTQKKIIRIQAKYDCDSPCNQAWKAWYMKWWDRSFIWNPRRFHIPGTWTSADDHLTERPCVLQKARTAVQACWTHPGNCTWNYYIECLPSVLPWPLLSFLCPIIFFPYGNV